MRKRLSILFTVILLCLSAVNHVSAAPEPSAAKDNLEITSQRLQSQDAVTIVIDGQTSTFSQPPVILNGLTLVPFRGIFELLGAQVFWNEKSRTVRALGSGQEIQLTIDSDVAVVNGNAIEMTQPAIIVNGSTMVPLRFVSESLGWNVTWEQHSRTAYIDPVQPETEEKNEQIADENPVQQNDEEQSILDWEKQVIELVNEERAKADLPPLEYDEKLAMSARVKSEDMRDEAYFDHISPVYGTPFEMMSEFGIDYMYAGENIAVGYTSPEAVVKAWMNSPGHKQNILSEDYTHIGVGYAKGGDYLHYWTQQFIGK